MSSPDFLLNICSRMTFPDRTSQPSMLTTRSLTPFRLLDLPPEIRTKIYVLLCTSPSQPIHLCTPSYISFLQAPSFPHDLLLTNTQLYHEIRPLYFSSNAFSLSIQRRNEHWSFFLAPHFRDNRRAIQKLRIVVLRWGSKDFFTRVLVPVVEDMVMNGRLRDLEVVVKQGFERDVRAGGGLMENWRILRRLLTDPYLERVRLVTRGDEGGCAGHGMGDDANAGRGLQEERDVTDLLRDLKEIAL